MPKKYVPFTPIVLDGQAILNNFTRTQRKLLYRDNDKVYETLKRGMPSYDLDVIEEVRKKGDKVEQPDLLDSHSYSEPNETLKQNLLIQGECLPACAYLKDKCIKVDLVYIDPPFASGADYSKKIFLRKNPNMSNSSLRIDDKIDNKEMSSFEEKLYGDIWRKEDYLNWMYENLIAIKSIMNDNASIYVHLDEKISHYVKVLLDEVFGESNFRREIIWDIQVLAGYKTIANNWIRGHDTILYYVKGDKYVFNKQKQPHRKEYLDRFDKKDKDGRMYFDGRGEIRYRDEVEKEGKAVGDVWYDIMSFQQIPTSEERADYATQKPKTLLERVIKSSSQKGMVVADFFGGSGVAAIAADGLDRKFIHVDVGVNSIQTARDLLIQSGADFDIMRIRDGVNLFRNPVQTMDKLKKLIPGLLSYEGLNQIWAGIINDTKYGAMPVYIPNLIDNSHKILDVPMLNLIINEAIPELPFEAGKAIIYYIDLEDENELNKFVRENSPVDIEFKDLKELLSEVVIDDHVDYRITEKGKSYEIEIIKFISDRLIQAIDEYNQKRALQPQQADILESEPDDDIDNDYINDEDVQSIEDNDDEDDLENEDSEDDVQEKKKGKKKIEPIKISEDGLELIELISLDCTNQDGIWHSDSELKIDKKSFVILDGHKTNDYWNGKITSNKKPLRMKVRNIAGDEIIVMIQ